MAQVATVDWPNKDIYLHLDTLAQGWDAMLMHFEIAQLVSNNTDNSQNYSAATEAVGNISKDVNAGTFTPRYVLLLSGWRVIPFDQSQTLDVLVEVVSDDQIPLSQIVDRSSLTPGNTVDLNPLFDKVEIREVATGGGTYTDTDRARDNQTALDASAVRGKEGIDTNGDYLIYDANGNLLAKKIRTGGTVPPNVPMELTPE